MRPDTIATLPWWSWKSAVPRNATRSATDFKSLTRARNGGSTQTARNEKLETSNHEASRHARAQQGLLPGAARPDLGVGILGPARKSDLGPVSARAGPAALDLAGDRGRGVRVARHRRALAGSRAPALHHALRRRTAEPVVSRGV